MNYPELSDAIDEAKRFIRKAERVHTDPLAPASIPAFIPHADELKEVRMSSLDLERSMKIMRRKMFGADEAAAPAIEAQGDVETVGPTAADHLARKGKKGAK